MEKLPTGSGLPPKLSGITQAGVSKVRGYSDAELADAALVYQSRSDRMMVQIVQAEMDRRAVLAAQKVARAAQWALGISIVSAALALAALLVSMFGD
jgi:hypothetical protein